MGDGRAPTAGESTDQMMQGLTKNLGPYLSMLSSQILPTEQAMQDASKIITPQQNQLELDTYKNFAPQLNKVGTDIEGQNQQARATNDLNVLKGTGAETVAQTKALDQNLNPEFYATRSKTSDALGNLLGSFDVSGKLSGGERTEVERANNKMNLQRGISGVPTGIGAISAAMNFGQAGQAKKERQQAGLTSAVGQATGFLPASKSGIDPLQTGLGRPSQVNAGNGLLPGAVQTGQQAYSLGSGLAGQIGGFQQQANQINANRRSGLDVFNQTLGALPSCCFIFMEYYGYDLPSEIRISRDLVYTEPMRRGYMKVSKWITPLIRRSDIFRKLINAAIIYPLSEHAHGRVHRTTRGWQYSPIVAFWLNTWTLLGKLTTTY